MERVRGAQESFPIRVISSIGQSFPNEPDSPGEQENCTAAPHPPRGLPELAGAADQRLGHCQGDGFDSDSVSASYW